MEGAVMLLYVCLLLCFAIILLTAQNDEDIANSVGSEPWHRKNNETLNKRPVIGVLTQETPDQWKELIGDYFVETSYVQYLHAAGALVVPIKLNQTNAQYKQLFSNINGILFPGGFSTVTRKSESQYGEVGRLFYKWALETNDKGDVFPLWGTCLGFELLSVIAAGDDSIITNCSAEDLTIPVKLYKGAQHHSLFSDMPPDLVHAIQNKPITANFHTNCVTTESYHTHRKLHNFYDLLATSKDFNGIEFVAIIQAKDYPFFGVQWHPEKNNFGFDYRRHNTHMLEGVKLSQYNANFFVDIARRNSHRFPDDKSLASALIENTPPLYLGYPTLAGVYSYLEES